MIKTNFSWYKMFIVFVILLCSVSLFSCDKNETNSIIGINQKVCSKNGDEYIITSYEILDDYLIIEGNFKIIEHDFSTAYFDYTQRFQKKPLSGCINLDLEKTNLLNNLDVSKISNYDGLLLFAFNIKDLKRLICIIKVNFGIVDENVSTHTYFSTKVAF